MKRILLILFLVAFAAFVLAACGTPSPVLDRLIPLKVGQPVEIANGEVTLTLEYQGKDEFNQYHWSCSDGINSCAERHSNEPDMVFYYDFQFVGATKGDSFQLVPEWEVKLYP